MSTTIASDCKVGARPRWWALGIDTEDYWHTVRARRTGPDEIVVVAPDGTLAHRQPLANGVRSWVRRIADEAGWQEHPEATPGRGWLDGALGRSLSGP